MGKKSRKSVPQEEGDHAVGRFTVRVRRCVFDASEEPAFWEVMVSERVGDGTYYVHLTEDPRFGHLRHVGSFLRPLRPEELEEHNSFVYRQRQEMPTWKLSRESLAWVAEACASAPASPALSAVQAAGGNEE